MIQNAWLEIRPRLRACNVVLLLKHTDISLTVTKSSIEVTRGDEKCVLTSDQLCFEPLSVSGFFVKKQFVCFRLSVDFKDETKGVTGVVVAPVAAGCEYSVTCRCGNIIIPDVSFDRVLPLPSQDFDLGDMFCHFHGKERHLKLAPRKSDCLYGTHYVQIDAGKVRTGNGPRATCERCLAHYGTLNANGLTLWLSDVSFGRHGPVNEQFVALMRHVVASSFSIATRIVFTNDKARLLVWVVDKQLQVYRCDKHLNLKQDVVMKVQFSFHPKPDAATDAWEKESSVHLVTVSDLLLLAAFRLLTDAAEKMPPMFSSSDEQLLAYV